MYAIEVLQINHKQGAASSWAKVKRNGQVVTFERPIHARIWAFGSLVERGNMRATKQSNVRIVAI